jgi:uncharacterized protein with GYD domain
MATFILYGKYSSSALQQISAERTTGAVELIAKFGGEVESMYATLGEHDLVLVVDFPGVEEALKASVALARSTGIGFTTAPAVSVEEFDQIMGDV